MMPRGRSTKTERRRTHVHLRDRQVALAVVIAIFFTACGTVTERTPPPGVSISYGPLREACGPKLVLQTDWFPEPEHGGSYQLIGPSGRFSKERGTYTGEIGKTGVELEIRAGGPYLSSQPVTSLMYQDESIFMGYVSTEEAVRYSRSHPTVAIFAPLVNSPHVLMWNPAKYSFKSLEDIGRSQAKVVYTEGVGFMDYLVSRGYIRKDQLDPSYDGSPARFVAEGDVVQEAFATDEPYKYEHDIPQWKKPVAFLLVSTGGYRPYPMNVAVRPQVQRKMQGCLRVLVPMMQQAQVDYMINPEPINETMLRIVTKLASLWILSKGGVADATMKMRELKIVDNGTDGAIGSFDMPRIREMIDLLGPIYAKQGILTMKAGLMPENIATNDFIDRRIKLP